MTHGEFTKHITLTPSSVALQSDVTEAIVLFFPPDLSPSAKASVTAQLQQFIEKSIKEFADTKATSFGWGVENDFPIREGDGQTGSIVAAFIGFPSRDAHVRFREMPVYIENLDSIKNIEGLSQSLVFHMNCRSLD